MNEQAFESSSTTAGVSQHYLPPCAQREITCPDIFTGGTTQRLLRTRTSGLHQHVCDLRLVVGRTNIDMQGHMGRYANLVIQELAGQGSIHQQSMV
jgi:hypothetical protein